ncbi:hypothetical protein WJX72_006745 [[Myrmecia] bisecta]|uniref:Uncharacterized protein n=1 Tax=[Myrmecia] bisecta TaxID=41462 RepID=A0AAW1PAI4_9CHLO
MVPDTAFPGGPSASTAGMFESSVAYRYPPLRLLSQEARRRESLRLFTHLDVEAIERDVREPGSVLEPEPVLVEVSGSDWDLDVASP